MSSGFFLGPPTFDPGDIESTTSGVTITNGENSTVGPDVQINISDADATHDGLLQKEDWVIFNSKDPGGSAAAAQAFAIQRSNHTGTQLASTISDFAAAADAAVLPTGGTTGQVLSKVDGTNYNVQWSTPAGSTPTGDPMTFAGFDSGGNLFTIPDWSINAQGGANQSIFFNAVEDAAVHLFNNFQNTVTATEDLTNTTYFNTQFYTYLNGDFDHHESHTLAVGMQADGIGNFGNVQVFSLNLTLGDGTNISESETHQLQNDFLRVQANHTVNTNIALRNSQINIDAGGSVAGIGHSYQAINVNGVSTQNINHYALDININADQPGGVGVNHLLLNAQINGAIQYGGGVAVGWNFNSGANVANSFQGHEENSHWYSGSTMNGHSSYTAYPNFDSGVTINGGYQFISASPTINADFLTFGVGGSYINPQINAPVNNMQGYQWSPNISATGSVSGGIQGYTDNLVIRTGATINDHTSFGAYPTLESGATANVFRAFNTNVQVDGTVTQGVYLGDWSVQSSTVIPEINGMRLNFSQAKASQPMMGYSVQDGRIDIQAKYSSEEYGATPGFIGLNGIGGLFSVDAGFPISNTLTLANSIGMSAIFWDDYGADPFVGTLGFANIASVAQMGVHNTKSVSAYNHLLIAVSVPDLAANGFPTFVDGGTLDNAYFVRLPGFLAQGGDVSITNQYQIYMDAIGGAANATNAWGLYIADSAYENYIKGSINIDTASGKVSNGNVGFEIGGTAKVIRNSVLTDTQVNAITPLNGMQTYNSTKARQVWHDGSRWNESGVFYKNHLLFPQTTPPVVTPDANAGTGATGSVSTGSADASGQLTLTTGSASWVAGDQVGVAFDQAYDTAPSCIIFPANDNAMLAMANVYVTTTTTGFKIVFYNPDSAATTYIWHYQVSGN